MKKRLLALALALIMTLGLFSVSALADGGTVADTSWYTGAAAGTTTFEISDAADLLGLASLVNGGTDTFAGKTVKLTADISLTGIEWTPIGQGDENTYFQGEFDGNSKTITGLTMTTGTRMGLFGLVTKSYLHDFTLKNVSFTATADNTRIGAVAGNLQYWNVVEDVTIDGITIVVNGKDGLIGGVVGYMWQSQMSNVDVKNANITASGTGNTVPGHTAYARGHVWDTGVVGNNSHWLDGTVDSIGRVVQNLFMDCDVTKATLTLTGSGVKAGGFFGSSTYNSHSNYFVNCTVSELEVNCTAGEGKSYTVGGFAAWVSGSSTVTPIGTALDETLAKGYYNCSASGTINGADGAYGGFVGYMDGRAHNFCNATADVDIVSTGTAGGFVGAANNYASNNYSFTDCEAKGDVTGAVAGGFAGSLGLAGDGYDLNVTISDCAAEGTVSGTTAASGFVARVSDVKSGIHKGGTVTISACKPAADVTVTTGGTSSEVVPPVGEGLETITYTVAGGTFQNEPEAEHIAEGSCVVSANGKYTVARHGKHRTSVVTTAPTYSTEGVRTYYCANCAKPVGTEAISKLTYTAPTYTVPTWPVTLSTGAHGSVTASATRASSGSAVVLTVEPKTGYKLDSLLIVDENGKSVAVTQRADGRYSFVMPDCGVTITTRFLAENWVNPFTDISTADWYYDAVSWACQSGVATGTSATTFSPNDSCTRAQLVTLLWRAAGEPEPASKVNPFGDVAYNSYYKKAVLWAVEQGITTGTSATTFSPEETCTRAEAVTFLFRYAAANGMDAVTLQELVSGYGDAAGVPGYSLPAFNWALASKLVQGAGGKLLPNDSCTRAQIVTMLYRFFG